MRRYAAQYQTVLEDYGDVENPTTGRTVAAFASAILSPLAGIGNCFVFLYFQSDARIYIFSMLRSIFCADNKVPGKPLVKQTVATSIEPIYGHRLSSTAHVMFETMTGDELLTEIDTQFRNSLLVIRDSSVVMNTIHTK